MSRLETSVVGNATTHVGASALTANVVRGVGGIVTRISTNNVSATPTAAEITGAFGSPATVGAGFVGLIDDNGLGTAMYICASDGANWHYSAMTKAV